jgi:hypothetical protein
MEISKGLYGHNKIIFTPPQPNDLILASHDMRACMNEKKLNPVEFDMEFIVKRVGKEEWSVGWKLTHETRAYEKSEMRKDLIREREDAIYDGTHDPEKTYVYGSRQTLPL